MKMTLEQVKEDIASGKSTMIYYSSRGCWWTHLDSDLEEAMEQGKDSKKRKHADYMSDERNSDKEKERFNSLYEQIKDSGIPTDPSGVPLFQTDDLKNWISSAESNPNHYGRHKLDAFMKSHHQNCEGNCLTGWEGYNLLIDSAALLEM